MLKDICLSLFLGLIITPVFAQYNVDSVRKISVNSKVADSLRAKATIELAAYYYNQRDLFDSTIFYAEKGEVLANKVGWKSGLMQANYLKGGANSSLSKYEVASKQLFDALRIAEELNDKPTKALIIKDIGYVFLYTGNSEKAIEWFNKMYAIFIEIGDKQKAAFTLGSIGTVYYADSNNVEAIKYFKRAEEIGKEINDENVLRFIYSNGGLAYFYNGQQQLGTAYVLKSLKISERTNSSYDIAFDLTNLTHFSEMTGDFDQTLKYGSRALPILRQLGLKEPLRSVLDNLRTVYKSKGDFANAYKYQREYYELTNEIDTENTKKEAEIQELEYDAEKDQLEIENLNKDIENRRLQQILLFGGIVVLLGIGGVLWWTNKSLNKKNALIAEQNAEIEGFNKDLEQKVAERTAELQEAYNEIKEAMTKGQTMERKRIASDLHDNLGSVISAINFSLSGIKRENLQDSQRELYDNIVQMTDAAYNDLRSLSHNLLPEKLEKEGLVSAVENYLDSLNAAQPVWFDFTTNTLERFSKNAEVNLYAVIMECCNNILKHAQSTEAAIEINVATNSIQVSVKDDGVGINLNDTDGFGLKNIRERLLEIKGEVTILPSITGTHIRLLVPLTAS